MREGDERIDTWAEIEDAIARQIEKKLAAEMFDQKLAALRAQEFAGEAVRLICSMRGGEEVYVPKLARHHREERDTQIKMTFNGACKETAREVGLSARQVRNIVSEK